MTLATYGAVRNKANNSVVFQSYRGRIVIDKTLYVSTSGYAHYIFLFVFLTVVRSSNMCHCKIGPVGGSNETYKIQSCS